MKQLHSNIVLIFSSSGPGLIWIEHELWVLVTGACCLERRFKASSSAMVRQTSKGSVAFRVRAEKAENREIKFKEIAQSYGHTVLYIYNVYEYKYKSL